MKDEDLKIQVFEDINDTELKTAWQKLQHECQAFPQMYYEWIEPWVRLRFNNRKLRIIAVKDSNQIIAIAPFCINRRFGIKILESIPIHYGDRYEFIIDKNHAYYKTILKCIFSEISNSKLYSTIVINQISKGSKTYNQLNNNDFLKKELVKCPVSVIDNTSYNEFLSKLKSKVRSNFRNRLRKLNKLGDLTFEVNSDSNYYLDNQKEFREMYEKRWMDVDRKLPDNIFYKCREESFCAMLDKEIAYNIVLKLNENIIGYRLGFIYDNRYYDWKICYDVDYKKFGLGAIMTAKLIENLIENKIIELNHGAGGYSYKTDWTPQQRYTENFKFVKHTTIFFGKLMVNYEIKYKDMFKRLYIYAKKMLNK